jgi:purine nucleosidase
MLTSCLSALAACSLLLSAPVAPAPDGPRTRVVIDADTANEVDDPYAIVRALLEPSLDVVALSSAQWQSSHWATPNTMEDSQRLNEVLLGHLGRMSVRHPRGAVARLYDWGEDLAQHSAAADFLVTEARRLPSGAKLTVIVLGAATNLASALLIDPGIAPKLRVFLLGTGYDGSRGVWTKLDFNCINDPRAINVVLDAEGLETHVMPHTTAAAMHFEMREVEQHFSGRREPLDFLVQRWKQHMDASRAERVIWDLALVEAVIHPEFAVEREARTPPENTARTVGVFASVDAAKMKADFFAVLDRFARERP